MSLSRMTFSRMTLSMITLSKTTLSKMPVFRMSWTWAGNDYNDYNPVFRYKDESAFFQTGRNNAEARWRMESGCQDDDHVAQVLAEQDPPGH